MPVHRHDAMRGLVTSDVDTPVADRLASEILSLPMFPTISQCQQEQVAAVLSDVV